METQLEKNLNQILDEKQQKILPENIKLGVEILGVVGTVQEGLDTSNATATADDIMKDKIAYGSDGELIGTLEEEDEINAVATLSTLTEGIQQNENPVSYTELLGNIDERTIIKENGNVKITASNSDMAEAFGIKAEDLIEGKELFGLTGTLIKGTDTSDADATAGDIIAPKVAYVNGERIEGTIEVIYKVLRDENEDDSEETPESIPPEPTAVEATIGGQRLIRTVIKEKDAATESDILRDKTAYVNGEEVVGTIDSIEGDTLLCGYDYVLDGSKPTEGVTGISDDVVRVGMHTFEDILVRNNKTLYCDIPDSSVADAIDLKAEQIVKGNTILGVAGKAIINENGTDTSDADATADEIQINKTAYVDGEKIVGTLVAYNDRTLDAKYTINNSDNEEVTFQAQHTDKIIYNNNASIYIRVSYNKLAEAIGLTPDKLKEGVTVLGITGTGTEHTGGTEI